MLIAKNQINKVVSKLKTKGKTIVFTNGCFDILHAGHVRYLNAARELGDCLVLGLNSDISVKKLKGENRPINSETDRVEVLNGLRAVDYVVIFDEETAENILGEVNPDIYVKGGDYSVETLPEAKVVLEQGGKIVLVPLVEGKSSTNIINKCKENKIAL